MRDLRLVGLSEDGLRLVLEGPGGEQFTLPLDERIHAALRGDRARLGQLQIELESRLRPRDIQARIRAGQSLEEVALEAGISVERVRRYAGPVLHEREHMAQEAARAGVKRDDAGAVTLLGELIAGRLESRGVPPEELTWDAWRREDGRWEVRLTYAAAGGQRIALWVYDPTRRTVVPDDDEASWLLEEGPDATVTPLRAVPGPTLPEPPDETADQVDDASQGSAEPVSADEAGAGPDAAGEPEPAAAEPESAPKPRASRASKAKPAKAKDEPASRRKKATVPSWDEILFGAKKPE